MGKRIKKVKKYVKEHKKIFIIGGGLLLTAAGVIILKKKLPKTEMMLDPKILGEGGYESLINDGIVNVMKWSDDNSYGIRIVDNMTLVRDMRTIADDICEFVPGITQDNRISMLLFVSDEKGMKKT